MDDTTIKLEIPAEHKHLNIIGACLTALLERVEHLNDREMLAYNLELALHETCTNIVEHAYSEQIGRIQIAMSIATTPQRKLIIDLFDTGKSFVLENAESPDLENAQVHGYGLYLMRQLLDEVIYNTESEHNHWRLIKNL